MVLFTNSRTKKKIEALNATLENSFANVKDDINKVYDWINYLHKQNYESQKKVDLLNQKIVEAPTHLGVKEMVDEKITQENITEKFEELNRKINSISDSHDELSSVMYHLEELKSRLQEIDESNSHVGTIKQKVDKMVERIEYFDESYEKILKLTNQFRDIKERMNRVEGRSELIDKFEDKLNNVSKRLDKSEEKFHTAIKNKLSSVSPNMQPARAAPKRQDFSQKLIKKIPGSSKDHAKNIIKNLIAKYGQITAKQLREIVVEEQGLLSKSSFYRILEEVETEENFAVIHDKKQKKYVHSSIKSK